MSLVSRNTLSATPLSVDAAQHSFMLEGAFIAFDDVKSVDQKFTELYVNSVYMGKLLEVELRFHSARQPFTASVDTRHAYDYARLYQLVFHLYEYRQPFEQADAQGQVSQPAEQAPGHVAKSVFLFGMLALTAFAVNGWFELCCLNNPWIDVLSLLAQILWPIVLLVLALQWLWLQPSQRKQMQREAELERQTIAGQLPPPPNVGWIKQWAWLWMPIAWLGLILVLGLWLTGQPQ